jgi:hypothetical protein
MVGIYAQGRDAAAAYRLLSVDSDGRRSTRPLLLGAPPPTFANRTPYTDDDERAVADPAIAYHRPTAPETAGPIFIAWRYLDGTRYTIRQLVLDDHLEYASPSEPVLVEGVEVEASDVIGRDPALLSVGDALYLIYISAYGEMRALRWIAENNWEDVQGVLFGGDTWQSVTQPALAAAGSGLPAAIRLEYRMDGGGGADPYPLLRAWTNPSGTFAFESFVRNKWDAAYRGAVRLTDFNGTEVAAVVGLYDAPLSAGGNCAECDCHKGIRRLPGGGYAGCGRDDADPTPDLDACLCSNARGILFRPIADGVINAVLGDHDDWSVMAVHVCTGIRGCAPCTRFPDACPASP